MILKKLIKKKSFNTLEIQSYLFVLLPIFLITGPFLSDLTISIISFLFLIEILKKKKIEFLNHIFFKFFFCFWVYIILNSLLQYQNFSSIKISLFYIRFGLFVCALIMIINSKNKVVEHFFISLVFCFLILIFDGFIQYFTGTNIFGYKLYDEHRISSFFGNEQILGSYISRFFPILLGLFIFFQNKYNKKIYYFIFIFIFISCQIITFLSGERTAFFLLNLSTIFMMIFLKNFKKFIFFLYLIVIFLMISLTQINSNIKIRMVDQTIEQLNLKSLIKKPEFKNIIFFSNHHTDHYRTSLNIFKDNILFGVGVKNFRNQCKNEKYSVSDVSCSTHPHNSYIQLITETGLIGVLYLFGFLGFFLFKILKHIYLLKKNKSLFSDYQICLLSAILITIWPFVPSGNFFNNWLSIIYYLPLGLILSLQKMK